MNKKLYDLPVERRRKEFQKIKKKLSSSYTADDSASIDFLTPTIVKDSFFEEVSFSFLVNRSPLFYWEGKTL